MNPAFTEFMESSCLALAREVPEFPTQMGMFEIAGEAVPQNYFTGIDAESVTRRQQLLGRSGCIGTTERRYPRFPGKQHT